MVKIKGNLLFCFLLFQVEIVADNRICLVSMPKCGTWMTSQLLEKLTGKKPTVCGIYYKPPERVFKMMNPYTHFMISHAIASPENLKNFSKYNYKVIFIYRDPRDQVVSLAYYVKRVMPQNWPFLDETILQLTRNFIDNILFLGKEHLPYSLNTIAEFWAPYLPWLNDNLPFVYTTNFESLVGKEGGGSFKKQFQEIKNIANHLELNLSEANIKDIIKSLHRETCTFRAGKIGAWKEEFDNETKILFKKIAGQLLIDLNYEQDFQW